MASIHVQRLEVFSFHELESRDAGLRLQERGSVKADGDTSNLSGVRTFLWFETRAPVAF
jgi:hypothetical protein